jgi:hypothetical protein
MKRYFIVALLASSLNAQTVTPTNTPVTNTLKYGLDTGYQLTGKALIGDHNIQYTHIFDETFKIAVQGDFFTNYEHNKTHNTKDDWATYLKERYLRVKFIGSPFVNILGFKTGWEVRYFLPIDQKSHQAGSFGTVQTSLVMNKQFNSHFNLTIVPKFVVGLHQRSYQLYGSQKENELGALLLELNPQWVIIPGLTLTYSPMVFVLMKGATPSKKSTTYTYNYRHDVELLYTLKNFYNLGLGPIWQIDNYEFGNGSHYNKPQNDFFKGARNLVGLRILKSFDL